MEISKHTKKVIVNYSLILLILVEYIFFLKDIKNKQEFETRDIYLELLGFSTLILLIYNYYEFSDIKNLYIFLLIFIVFKVFIFFYYLKKY